MINFPVYTPAVIDNKYVQTGKGVREKRNKVNGYYVYEVHYSADPEKDNDEFRAKARQGISLQKYLQEFEIDWTVVSGTPVWPEYSETYHKLKFDYNPAWPLIVTYDPGVWSCALFSQLTPWAQLRILGYDMNMAELKFEQAIKRAKAKHNYLYPNDNIVLIADVASKKTQEMVEYTAENLLEKHYGKKPIMNSLAHHKEECINLVGACLLENIMNPESGQQERKIIVHESAELVHTAMKGGYRYKEQKDPAAPKTVSIEEQHPFEDIADVINYTVYWAFLKAESVEEQAKKKEFAQKARLIGEIFEI